MRKILSIALASVLMCICMVVFSGCSDKSPYSYENADAYISGGATLEVTELQAIDVDWISGKVTIEVVDDITQAVIEESSRYAILDDEALRYSLSEEGILTIKFRASSDKKVNLTKEKDLTIKLPRAKFVKGNIVVNSVSSDVYLNRVESGKINVTNVSGDVTIINSRTSMAEVTSVSGNIKLKNSALYDLRVDSTSANVEGVDLTVDKLDFNSVSGVFNVSVLTAPISISAESVSGDMAISIPADKGFTANFESVSGSLVSQFEVSKEDGKYIYLDGEYNYNFETVSANISLIKK